MDSWLHALPRVFRGCDGPHDLRPAPRVRTEAALYGRLLRLDRPDAILFARCKFINKPYLLLRPGHPPPSLVVFVFVVGLADISWGQNIAPKHDPHPLLGHRPAGRAGVVPGQLLPDGVERPAPGDQLWGPKGGGLDDGLMMAVAQLVERDWIGTRAVTTCHRGEELRYIRYWRHSWLFVQNTVLFLLLSKILGRRVINDKHLHGWKALRGSGTTSRAITSVCVHGHAC